MNTKSLLTILCLCSFFSSYAQYCITGGPSQTIDSNTETVILNGISGGINYTGCPGIIGIEDFTATQQVALGAGSSYSASMKFGTCGGDYGNHAEAWIDYNQNQIFEASESILTWQGTPPMAIQAFNFTVPSSAISGTTRMRIIQREGATGFPLDPCASFNWGSVLDFTVNIQGGGACFVVNSYPYLESFEGSLGGWSQETANDSIDWTILSGATTTVNSGPSSAADGNFYIYTEATNPNFPNKIANVVSPCFDLTTLDNPKLNFKYHMYGSDMGTLNLQVSVNASNWSTIWSKTGDQGNNWIPEVINLNAYTNASDLRFRFNGITGNGFNSDMAVDAIGINCSGFAGDEKPDAILVNNYPYVDTNSTVNCYNNFSLVYNSPDVFYLAVLDTLKDSLRVSLCGSDFDTHLSIQDMSGNVIFYNDDFGSCAPQSELLFPTAGLDSVFVIVEGWNNLTGNYIINIDNDYTSPDVSIHYVQGKAYNIQLYPNPTQNRINIEGITPEQIYVFSMDGKMMAPTASNKNSIDLSSLPAGIYILDLIFEGQHFREKIIKE